MGVCCPIESHCQVEASGRRRKPVRLLVGPWIVFLDVDVDRAVNVLLQAVGRTADAVAFEVVLDEELLVVVHAHVPEHRDRRRPVLVKMQDVFVGGGQRLAFVIDASVRIEDFLGHIRAGKIGGERGANRIIESGATAAHRIAIRSQSRPHWHRCRR